MVFHIITSLSSTPSNKSRALSISPHLAYISISELPMISNPRTNPLPQLELPQMTTSTKQSHHCALIRLNTCLLHHVKAIQCFFKSITLHIPRNHGIPRHHILPGDFIKESSSIIHTTLRDIPSNQSRKRNSIS
ncbi:hypothetical protein Ahy_A01g000442 isoform D [Arachis hypogaea]|uniref:Uncharacterized protein n=1 Tax=Arachis hypogaea TaxID=3818 RepID=A0A445EK67_ARAHY|nr:hypothetical protein Ahy_A01g000442 isoform D [Arachis hypogaea]